MRSFQVCTCGQPLQCNEYPTPKPTGTEVLLKVLAAGVCHSDLHLADGYFDLGGGKRMSLEDRGMKLPVTLGHENVGEVVAVGPQAEGRENRRPQAGAPLDRLRHVRGLPAWRRKSLPRDEKPRGVLERRLFRLFAAAAPTLPDRHRRSAGRSRRAARVFRRHRLQRVEEGWQDVANEPVVIIGAGGVGLMCIDSQGDGRQGRRRRRHRFEETRSGENSRRDWAVDGSAPDAAVADLVAATNGGAWAVIDLVGSSATARLGIDSLIKGGKYIIVGLYGGDITLSLPPMRAITIQGSYVGSLLEMRELIELVRRTGLPPVPVATRPLDDVNAGDEASSARARSSAAWC